MHPVPGEFGLQRSALCIDNSCADPIDVSYVEEGGDDTRDCSQAAPCATLKRAIALDPRRKYIKATGRLDDTKGVDIDGKTANIFGEPGMTTLVRSTAGPVMQIRKAAMISLTDLEISGELETGNGMELKELGGGVGPMVTMTRVSVRKHKQPGSRSSRDPS